MPLSYTDFDVRIEAAGRKYKILAESSAGEAAEEASRPLVSRDRLKAFLFEIGRPRHDVRRVDSPEMDSIRVFGGQLFKRVFQGDVLTRLASSIDDARQHGLGLRIRLRLAPELADLPWEYLYDGHQFLGLSTSTPIVRYIELPRIIEPLSVAPPLRVLVAAAGPTGYPRLDVEQEYERLESALQPLTERGSVSVERLVPATADGLHRRLRVGTYHVFHFIGHGAYDAARDDGVLLLEDEFGQGWRMAGEELGMLLHDHHSLRLAILNSCEGARGSVRDPFSGAAQSLVAAGVPAVIAMQFEITDQAAIRIAQAFYAAVADGFPVDAALADARKALRLSGNEVEWATPVLYMRAPDGRIFDIISEDVRRQEEQEREAKEEGEHHAREEQERQAKEEAEQHVAQGAPAAHPRVSVEVSETQEKAPLAKSETRVEERGPLELAEIGSLKHENAVTSVAFRSDAKYMATASLDGTVRIYNDALEEFLRLQHEGALEVEFSPSGLLLATAGRDKTARLWEVETGREITRLPHQGTKATLASRTLVFSPDSAHFLSAGDEVGAVLHDLASHKTIARLRHKKVVEEVAFSSRSKRAATASWDGTARVWDLAGRELLSLPHKWTTYNAPNSVAFSPAGDIIVTACAGFPEGTARFWSLDTGKEVRRTGSHGRFTYINVVKFSVDGRYLATLAGGAAGSYSNVACIWNAATGSQIAAVAHEGNILAVEFSPDGEYVATAGQDGALCVWKSDTGIGEAIFNLGAPANAVAWKPDGRAIACASDNSFAPVFQIWASSNPERP